MKVSLVPPEMLGYILEDIGPMIEIAADTTAGRYSDQDLYDHIASGKQMLWIAFDENPRRIFGILTTNIVDYPSRRMLSVQVCSGDRIEDWVKQMILTLERFAHDQKCQGIEMVGRRGWGRMVGEHGWLPQHTVYEKFFTEQSNGQE